MKNFFLIAAVIVAAAAFFAAPAAMASHHNAVQVCRIMDAMAEQGAQLPVANDYCRQERAAHSHTGHEGNASLWAAAVEEMIAAYGNGKAFAGLPNPGFLLVPEEQKALWEGPFAALNAATAAQARARAEEERSGRFVFLGFLLYMVLVSIGVLKLIIYPFSLRNKGEDIVSLAEELEELEKYA